MTNSLFKLWYCVHSSPFINVALIQLSPHSTVEILWELVIKSSQLDVPSNAVSLYKIPWTHSLDLSDNKYDNVLTELSISKLDQPLRVAQTVASIFTLHLQENHLHLIVGNVLTITCSSWPFYLFG